MKKAIATLMSAVLLLTAVVFPVSAHDVGLEAVVNRVIQTPMAFERISSEEFDAVCEGKGFSLPVARDGAAEGVFSGTLPEAVTAAMEPLVVNDQFPETMVAHITADMVILQKMDGYEYSMDGYLWQNSNVFTDLTAQTAYTFYQRPVSEQGNVSRALMVTTGERRACTATAVAPVIMEYTPDRITLLCVEGYEYRINGGQWQFSTEFTGLKPDTQYSFSQRIAQSNAEYASEPSEEVVFRTSKDHGSSAVHYDQLVSFIQSNGTADEAGDPSLVYSLPEIEGMTFYFILTDMGEQLSFQLVGFCSLECGLDTVTEFMLKKQDGNIMTTCIAKYFEGNEYLDVADDGFAVYRSTYTAERHFATDAAGTLISSENFAQVYDTTMVLLCALADEVLYSELGFGLRGLGFLKYEGYGEVCCDKPSGTHFGETVVVGPEDASCISYGFTEERYCSICAEKVQKGSLVTPMGHSYDNDCDPDCNTCGAVRHLEHYYSFACATECEICGAVREQSLGEHIPGGGGVCTVCGEKCRLPGDVSGDGRVNIGDVAKAFSHVRKKSLLTDPEDLAVADVTGDGRINIGDVARIFAHVAGKSPLW